MTNPPPLGSPGAPPTSYSTPSIGPRRSSYASVVSGTASASPQSHGQPTRSGALSHLMNPSFSANQPQQAQSGQQYISPSRSLEMDMLGNGASSLSGSWGRGGYLPSYASQFGFGLSGTGVADGSSDNFFVPSYLRNCRYVERLEEAHKAKLAAAREDPSSHSNTDSVSTSSSSANLHKLAPSHRGMTYDIIEKEPRKADDRLTPLPSRWSDGDKFGGIEIQADGLEIKFTGPSKSHDEAAAVRADNPMPTECGIYYYEVTVISKGKEGLIGVGFSGPKVHLNRLPGWEPESWAYHGDDGFSFCCTASGKPYGPKFSTSDVIGCGVNFRTGTGFFTKNGVNLGTAFENLNKGTKLFPSVGMKKPGENLKVNFGQTPFMFDIDGMIAEEKWSVEQEISQVDATTLQPPLDETSLIQGLVAQYLAHDGYVETARAFAEEVRSESRALQNGKDTSHTAFEAQEDMDAVNRQRIRAAILEGDIDKALKHTNAFYPSVFSDNQQIYFRLRCRKFIEMVRRCSELHAGSQSKQSQASNGHGTNDLYDDVFDHQMELDDQIPSGDAWDSMETEDSSAANLKYQTLLSETLEYGQELQSEFRDDGRRDVKKALKDTFSLLAYEDPKTSVVAHLLEPTGRVPVAEELNSAILVSLGRSSSAALERLYQQTEVLVSDISPDGGAGAFVNVANDFLK